MLKVAQGAEQSGLYLCTFANSHFKKQLGWKTALTGFHSIVLKKNSAFYLTMQGDKIQICVGQRPFYLSSRLWKFERVRAFEKESWKSL